MAWWREAVQLSKIQVPEDGLKGFGFRPGKECEADEPEEQCDAAARPAQDTSMDED